MTTERCGGKPGKPNWITPSGRIHTLYPERCDETGCKECQGCPDCKPEKLCECGKKMIHQDLMPLTPACQPKPATCPTCGGEQANPKWLDIRNHVPGRFGKGMLIGQKQCEAPFHIKPQEQALMDAGGSESPSDSVPVVPSLFTPSTPSPSAEAMEAAQQYNWELNVPEGFNKKLATIIDAAIAKRTEKLESVHKAMERFHVKDKQLLRERTEVLVKALEEESHKTWQLTVSMTLMHFSGMKVKCCWYSPNVFDPNYSAGAIAGSATCNCQPCKDWRNSKVKP